MFTDVMFYIAWVADDSSTCPTDGKRKDYCLSVRADCHLWDYHSNV